VGTHYSMGWRELLVVFKCLPPSSLIVDSKMWTAVRVDAKESVGGHFDSSDIMQLSKDERCGAGMVICLGRGADLHMEYQLMPLPLSVSCVSKIRIDFTFLVPAHPGSPGQKAIKRGCCLRMDIVRPLVDVSSRHIASL